MSSHTFARWISIALHPIVTLFVLVAAAAAPRANSLRIVALVAGVAFVPIVVILIAAKRSGRWQNVDASQPRERHFLFSASLVIVLVLAAAMLAWSPASYLARGTLAVGALLALAWIALRWIKLSLHVAFAAFSAVALAFIDWRLAAILFAVLPLIGWARLRLQRHSMTEVVAGGIAGFSVGLLLVLSK